MHRSFPTILIFDSGLGGLSVFSEVKKLLPTAHYIYVADDAGFPYGTFSAEALVARVSALMKQLIAQHEPDVVVIACNTASTLVLPHLRAAFAIPFVGTVPAIKPAAAQSISKKISILATPGTAKRDYTHELIAEHAKGCQVTCIGSEKLAWYAERELNNTPATDAEIFAEITPCFVSDKVTYTDTIVLACTHYPLLLDRLKKLAPWPVQWIDSAPAIARRVKEVLENGVHFSAVIPATGPGSRLLLDSTNERDPGPVAGMTAEPLAVFTGAGYPAETFARFGIARFSPMPFACEPHLHSA